MKLGELGFSGGSSVAFVCALVECLGYVFCPTKESPSPLPTVSNFPSLPYVAGWRWGGRGLGLALLKRYVGSPLHSRDAKHRRVNDPIRALVKSFQWRWNAGHDLLPQLGQLARQTVV